MDFVGGGIGIAVGLVVMVVLSVGWFLGWLIGRWQDRQPKAPHPPHEDRHLFG